MSSIAVVRHAGSEFEIELPPFDVDSGKTASDWIRALKDIVARVSGIPAESQRLLSKAWKANLSNSSFKDTKKMEKKILKCIKKTKQLVLMLFEVERDSETKIALGHATETQLFEEDVRAAVRRLEEVEAKAHRLQTGVLQSGQDEDSVFPARSDFVKMVEYQEERARTLAQGIRAESSWRRRAQQLHNRVGDAWAQWTCSECTFATNAASKSKCFVCKAPRQDKNKFKLSSDDMHSRSQSSLFLEESAATKKVLIEVIGLEGFNGHENQVEQSLARIGSRLHTKPRHCISWLPSYLLNSPTATLIQSSGECARDGQISFAFAMPCESRVWLAVSPRVVRREEGHPHWLTKHFDRLEDEVVLLSSHRGNYNNNGLDHLGLYVAKRGMARGQIFKCREIKANRHSPTGINDGSGRDEKSLDGSGKASPVLVFITTEETYQRWARKTKEKHLD